MTETYDKGWLRVSIEYNSHEELMKILDWEQKNIWPTKISFDTGAGFGTRDWELDWSLEGADPEEVLEMIDKSGFNYHVAGVPDQVLDD